MNYASANRRPNPAALVGALGIPGAFGALLVAPDGDTVLLEQIGHYPQTEAPDQVLAHYLQFRERLEAKRCSDVLS
mgnify:CR=1 FL=1